MGYDFQEPGVPAIDFEKCEGCGQCARICPSDVLVMSDGKPSVTPGGFMGCIACGHCVMACPTGAVTVSGRGLSPEDAVALPPPEARATAEQLEALLVRRRSIRRFKQPEIDPATIDRIVRMAALAPMGIPPHETGILVFAGHEKVQAFAQEACQSFGKMARFFNPVVLGLMRLFMGKARHAAIRDFIRPLLLTLARDRAAGKDTLFHNAPLVLLFHYGPRTDEGDCMIVATYAMLAAEALGLGSCMIGTTTAVGHDKRLKAKLGIPAESKVSLSLAVGHPAAKFQRGVARRLASVEFA